MQHIHLENHILFARAVHEADEHPLTGPVHRVSGPRSPPCHDEDEHRNEQRTAHEHHHGLLDQPVQQQSGNCDHHACGDGHDGMGKAAWFPLGVFAWPQDVGCDWWKKIMLVHSPPKCIARAPSSDAHRSRADNRHGAPRRVGDRCPQRARARRSRS